MAGKTPHQAVEQFLEPIRRSLSCVTTAVVHVAGGYHPQDHPHVLLLGKGEAVKLKGDLGLSLTVILHYRIVEAGGDSGSWKVRTAAYQYSVDNAQGREIFSYQFSGIQRGKARSRCPIFMWVRGRVTYLRR